MTSPFGEMVKFVTDVERRVGAIGGQMQADLLRASMLLTPESARQREPLGLA